MFVHAPKFEKWARAARELMAPTVVALGTKGGVKSQAPALLLPAATTTVSSRVPGGGFEHCPVP